MASHGAALHRVRVGLFPALSAPESRVTGTDKLRMPQHAANASFREETSLGNIPGMLQWKHNSLTSTLLLPAPLYHPLLLGAHTFPLTVPGCCFLVNPNHSATTTLGTGTAALGRAGRGARLTWGCKNVMGVTTLPWVKTMSFGASCET